MKILQMLFHEKVKDSSYGSATGIGIVFTETCSCEKTIRYVNIPKEPTKDQLVNALRVLADDIEKL